MAEITIDTSLDFELGSLRYAPTKTTCQVLPNL